MRLSPKEAAALGLIAPKKARTTRKTGRGPYHTRCTTCGEEFHTEASQDRHLTATDHHRYALVWVVD